MSWLIDNANVLYVLLGIVAAGFVVAWRFNQRVKFLGYAAGVLVLMGLLWVLTQLVVTDTKQIESNVHAMNRAFLDGRVDDLFKHIARDFRYHTMDRDALYAAARRAMERHAVNDATIGSFRVEKLSRETKSATASFLLSGSAVDAAFMFRVETDFILEGEAWKLKTLRFYNPRVNQDQEIRLPGL